ncbi:hypothetical protein D3C85_748250 [compost metagenome]
MGEPWRCLAVSRVEQLQADAGNPALGILVQPVDRRPGVVEAFVLQQLPQLVDVKGQFARAEFEQLAVQQQPRQLQAGATATGDPPVDPLRGGLYQVVQAAVQLLVRGAGVIVEHQPQRAGRLIQLLDARLLDAARLAGLDAQAVGQQLQQAGGGERLAAQI